jgi:hypothetical protein
VNDKSLKGQSYDDESDTQMTETSPSCQCSFEEGFR